MQPNLGKNLEISVDGHRYLRLPVKTHVVVEGEDIVEVVKKYTDEIRQPGDIIFISEKAVAIAEGRAFKIEDIKPSFLARFLVKFVHKSEYGIGLGSPWTMQLALDEAGAPRILLASLASLLTKPFGIHGTFYKVAGKNVNAIDGPCDYTLPPYNHYAKLGPKDPDKTAKRIKGVIGNEVVIIDANDLGVNVLGRSLKGQDQFYGAVFKDNPLGQGSEQTPIGVVRKLD
jgi:F420-0:gamma-glutamyl ligase-like protein